MKIFISEAIKNSLYKLSGSGFRKLINSSPELKAELSKPVFDIDGMYAKGGVAREALLLLVANQRGEDFQVKIRDEDYVFFGKTDDISKIRYEYDAELLVDKSYYFKNRDITLNEVLLNRNELIFSSRAIQDAKNKLLIPTKFERNKDYVVDGRMYARILYFAARYDLSVNEKIKYSDVNQFNLFICLLKAYELGIESEYFILAYKHGLVHEDIYNSDEWLLYFAYRNINEFDYPSRNERIKDIITSIKNVGVGYDTQKELQDMFETELDDLDKETSERYLKFLKHANDYRYD